MPPLACSKRPFLVGGTSECVFLVAEKLVFDQGRGDSRDILRDAVGVGLVLGVKLLQVGDDQVHNPGFARSGVAGNEYRISLCLVVVDSVRQAFEHVQNVMEPPVSSLDARL